MKPDFRKSSIRPKTTGEQAMRQSIATLSLIVLLVPCSSFAADGAGKKDSGPRVEFDHLTGRAQSVAVSANSGQAITILIKNTCPDRFQYELGGIPLLVPSPPAAAGAECTLTDHTLTQVHSEKFGGYYINVKPKAGTATPVIADNAGTPTELKTVTYLISVQTLQWDIGFAGGFTIADLVDPVFATRQDSMMQNILIRDKSAEDEVALGLAGMIHLYHRKHPSWAATFGLTTGQGSDIGYMLGGSYRFSDKGAITLGYMWADVDRLPAGLRLGEPVTDPNALSDLKTKTDGGIFLGISFSFISGVQDIFEKPFKGAEPAASGGASQATSPPTPGTSSTPATPRVPAGGDGGACMDDDDAGKDQDADGVMADQDADDCDSGQQ